MLQHVAHDIVIVFRTKDFIEFPLGRSLDSARQTWIFVLEHRKVVDHLRQWNGRVDLVALVGIWIDQ